MILAGDVGATKILLEVGEFRSDRWKTGLARRYSTSEAENFPALLKDFLGEWNAVREKDQRITAAGFGVAGPASHNKVKMTHRPIVVDGDAIATRFLIPKVVVVNDLAAAAQGIEWVPARECVTIQPGRASETEPRVVLGVGTGLGIAYLVPVDGKLRAVPGEGGHAGFAPATQAQSRAVAIDPSRRTDACSCEDICSGHGLAHIYSFVHGLAARTTGDGGLHDAPRSGSPSRRPAQGPARLRRARSLRRVPGRRRRRPRAGDDGARRRLPHRWHRRDRRAIATGRAGRFREAFCAKAPFSALLMKIPVRVITSERVAVLGAARLVLER